MSYENSIPGVPAGTDLEACRLVKVIGGAAYYVNAGETPDAITMDDASVGQYVALRPLAGGVFELTAAGPIATDARLYVADNGMVDDVAIGQSVGKNFKGSSAVAGEIFSAFTCPVLGENDAFAPDMDTIRWSEDFIAASTVDGGVISTTADKGQWLLTVVDGGSDSGQIAATADDGPGGILQLTTNDAPNDSCEMQLNGESFKLSAGKKLRLETRLAVVDVDKTDLFIGLAVSDTTVLAGASDRIGFAVDHDGNIDMLVEKNETEHKVDTNINIADCAAIGNFAEQCVDLAFEFDGDGKVKYFVNGQQCGTIVDDAENILIPDDEAMTPTVAIKATAPAAATAFIDLIQIVATR